MSNKNYCLASAVIFALVALMHIWRFVLDLRLQIGAWSAPRSFSLVGGVIAACFAIWAFRSSRGVKRTEVTYT